MPLPDCHSHIELAKWVFGMLMALTVLEIAGAKQMTAAGLNVVCFHLPRGPGWGRGHRQTHSYSRGQKARAYPFHFCCSFLPPFRQCRTFMMLAPRITCWLHRPPSKWNFVTRQLASSTMGTGGLNRKGQARAAPECPYLPV